MTTSIQLLNSLNVIISEMNQLTKEQKQFIVDKVIEIADLAHDEGFRSSFRRV